MIPRWLTWIVSLLLVLIMGWGVAIVLGGYLVQRSPSPIGLDEKKLLSTIEVSVEEMPGYVEQAFIAIEDHRFTSHFGIDLSALVRASWIDIRERSLLQGGSTITMQLARNLFLTFEQTMQRKLKEMCIALFLEARFSKKEILSLYVNNINFGHGAIGIEKAAQLYFDKTTQQQVAQPTIRLSEAALLAALPKAPNYYSPFNHPALAKKRRNVVLDRMAELKMITLQERKQAQKEPILSP